MKRPTKKLSEESWFYALEEYVKPDVWKSSGKCSEYMDTLIGTLRKALRKFLQEVVFSSVVFIG